MILGIDASNIRSGGGVTHLVNLLKAKAPSSFGIKKVIVWSNQETLNKIEDYPWLSKSHQPLLEKNLLFRSFWQRFNLSKLAREENCDALFVPGGSYMGSFQPVVTMCRNMLPFEPKQAAHFGRISMMRFKMRLLYHLQSYSFKRVEGIIFLTKYAKSMVSKSLNELSSEQAMIPHGIEQRFIHPPRAQRKLTLCSFNQPFRVLYVSILMPYKHQIEVATAVSRLRADGLPIEMRFIGTPWGEYAREFKKLLNRLDPKGEYLLWSGGEPFEVLHDSYKRSDAFVFASSCENLPNILIEAMAAGLPIACSNCGPMPEVLGDAGIYFNPDKPESIAESVRKLIANHDLRESLANMAWEKAKFYSWERCAEETYEFITKIYDRTDGSSLKHVN